MTQGKNALIIGAASERAQLSPLSLISQRFKEREQIYKRNFKKKGIEGNAVCVILQRKYILSRKEWLILSNSVQK